jgi:uncharacterized NAD(P)/FAD-binding protein YdhS
MDKTHESKTPFHAAVIGAGASGTLVAAQFKRLAPQARLAIVGNAARPARGVAYETAYHANLLNVPAGNMSAFAQDTDHFVNWLKHRQPKANAATFIPRRIYGDYLSEIFYETISDLKNTEYIVGSAINLSRKNDLWTIYLDNGDSFEAYKVVLAFGNLLIPSDPIDFSAVPSNYRRNPWAQETVQGLEADAPVLLIGTGLTMIDVALSLREAGHRGPIHAISRHGRLYQSHKSYQARPLTNLPADFESPLGALRWIRNQVQIAQQTGSDWRAVIDSLRPYTAVIWQSWDQPQKESFLRHARNLWDIHRHRMAPEISAQLGILVEDRVLVIHCGKLISAAPADQNTTVTWQDTDTGETHDLTVARVINCTGPSRDYSKIQSPLISALRAAGLLVPDALRLGFETDSDGRFVSENGESIQGLFTLGPVRIPALWESIAIPEIRNQALALAETLVAETIASEIPAATA